MLKWIKLDLEDVKMDKARCKAQVEVMIDGDIVERANRFEKL